jgi:hypothetical protein
MTDEALFYHRFVADVRSCAAGRAPAWVAEIERRVLFAMIAPPEVRDRRWAQVIAAIGTLLADVEQENGHAQRLRAFVRENADLWRARDVAISDFRIVGRPESVVTGIDGRRYLAFARRRRADARPRSPAAPRATRIAAWGVYALCTVVALTALWFAFALPL